VAADPAPSPPRPLTTLGWALFLAASWTWCIGMFLPVLLVRDYGLGGWVLFAVPNVVGAAAMGFVLRTRRASAEIVQAHRPACVAFSLTTIAFHCFFLGWITALMPVGWLWAGYGLVIVMFLAGLRRRAGALIAAALVTAVSLGVMAFVLRAVPLGEALGALPEPAGRGAALAMLAPAFLLGFGLCPYMDLTFHHARQANDARGSRIAFGLGFGVFFLAMIFLTLLYSARLAAGAPSHYLHLVGLHIVVQSGFTAVLHLEHLLPLVGRVGWKVSVPSALVMVVLFLAAPGISALDLAWGGVDGREVAYWVFMTPYGLVFPAYVWIVMLPERMRGKGGAHHLRRRLTVFGLVVLAALPMYWMGFVEKETVWLLPGVGLVLLAGAAIRRWR